MTLTTSLLLVQPASFQANSPVVGLEGRFHMNMVGINIKIHEGALRKKKIRKILPFLLNLFNLLCYYLITKIDVRYGFCVDEGDYLEGKNSAY